MLLPHPDAQAFVDAFDTPPAAPEPRGQQLPQIFSFWQRPLILHTQDLSMLPLGQNSHFQVSMTRNLST